MVNLVKDKPKRKEKENMQYNVFDEKQTDAVIEMKATKRSAALMKYLYLTITLFFASVLALSAQGDEKNCYYGIKFEISDNPAWGYGELVVTHVEPNTQAERSGIMRGDIIMEINGQTTYLRDDATIKSWLLNNNSTTAEFSIRNIHSSYRKVRLTKSCKPSNSVDEQQMSEVFSFYSLENTSLRQFTLPYTIETNNKVDYSDYRTYDFDTSGTPSAYDVEIINLLDIELKAKGMKRSTTNPDMVIQAYYSIGNNPQRETLEIGNSKTQWRYSSASRSMESIPTFDPNDESKYSLGTHIVNFGISLYDRKYLNSQKLIQIWDGKLKDYLSGDYDFSTYLKLHIPLMMMEYPYSTSKEYVKYNILFNKYNYIGLQLDDTDFSQVKGVDVGSPAYLAGIRAGSTITSINGKEFLYSKTSLSDAYKLFIELTMIYRDTTTRYTSAEGYTQSMLWDKKYYNEVAEAFAQYDYLSIFSYLYYFEKYVSGNQPNILNIEYINGKERTVKVSPITKESIEIMTN